MSMVSRTRIFSLAESLGGIEFLSRLSVGIEDVEDLIADLDRAIG